MEDRHEISAERIGKGLKSASLPTNASVTVYVVIYNIMDGGRW